MTTAFFHIGTQGPSVGGDRSGRSELTLKEKTENIGEQRAVLCNWDRHCKMRLVLYICIRISG